MDDKLNALDKLIEAVEAGDLDKLNVELGRMFAADHSIPCDTISNANSAFRGSLDAALALHEALLPGWALERLNKWPGTNGQCTAYLWGTHEEDGERWHNAKDGRVDANGPTPSRAWLIAILRAYRSVQE